jgi:hypothetical protein
VLRTILKLLGGIVAALLLYVGGMYVRYTYFPTRYAVTSIATTPEYQDPALLERAWALPVAATYQHHLDSQPNGSVCGPTSAANMFRSLGEAATTPAAVLDGSGQCPLTYCPHGLSLDELAEVMRRKTQHHVTLMRGLSLAEFREQLAHSNDPSRRYIVNFNRGLLFGKGGGHHSPIGGYLPARDLVFVLDVNAKFGPWLVSTQRLYDAMNAEDPTIHQRRGLLLIE